MNYSESTEYCLLVNVGVVARGSRCLTIMRALDSIRPARTRLKLVAIAAVTKSVACYKYAGESDIAVFDDYRDLVKFSQLDLVLELTGDPKILSDIMLHKSPMTGVLDRQASMLFFDLASLYEQVAHREAEISLASSFSTALLEASPDGVMVVDRNYRIINCNRSPLITGGIHRDAVIGKYCHEVLHKNKKSCGRDEQICPFVHTLKTGLPTRRVHEIPGPNGELQVTQVTAYPIFNQFREIVQFVVTIRDMTSELIQRIEKREQAIKADLARFVQEDRLASLGRLMASVCHEINNPIASIVTFNKLILSYLQEDKLPPEGKAGLIRYLDLSVKEALRCGNIINNLLTFARQKSIETKAIDLNEVINTIVLLTSHKLEISNVAYRIDLPRPAFHAWGDSAQIQQCIMNLVFNALEAMPNGGEIAITGGIDETRDGIWLTVADTGDGIPESEMSKIFEPFYSTKSEGKGVGLGLSMVYGIIREHKGTIDVKSAEGRGSVFTIRLPRRGTNANESKKGAIDE
jgi:two-component system NtrC family sensor kinase